MTGMDFELLSVGAAVLVTLTALLLLAINDWRLSIILIAMQYSGVFLLVASQWPLSMAISKLLVGWIAGAVLGMAFGSSPELRQEYQNSAAYLPVKRSASSRLVNTGRTTGALWFYILTALAVISLIGMALLSRAGSLSGWLVDIQPASAWGAMALLSIGLVKLGFTTHPLHTILGLLTALSGFEVIYAHVEPSALVAELLAGITLGLALAGVYLLLAPNMREDE